MKKFHSRVDWLKLADQLDHASQNPKVSKINQEKSARGARLLRAFKPLRDRVMAKNASQRSATPKD